MYKACGRCGGIHELGYTCNVGRYKYKKNTKANKLRNEYSWKQKRKEIKERDKYLCQVCLTNKYSTTYAYTHEKLEVHHIIPIEQDEELALENSNLITLCPYHHHMADKEEIPKEELQELVPE